MKQGKVTIEFAIKKNGKVSGMRLVGGSGDVLLDRAAWAGITGDPFAPLHKRIWGPTCGIALPLLLQP
jgi:TonB family protein